jgi:hypothetical protein
MGAKLLALLKSNLQDIPNGLRKLADQIEGGNTGGDCHNIAYVIDTGNGVVECGLLGACSEGGPIAHLLFAKAQRALENG